jgi:hypothetical protein
MYCRKRDPAQAFWRWIDQETAALYRVPWLLVEVAAENRTLVGPHEARRALDFLHHELGFRDDDPGGTGTPVVFEDFDGNPVIVRG